MPSTTTNEYHGPDHYSRAIRDSIHEHNSTRNHHRPGYTGDSCMEAERCESASENPHAPRRIPVCKVLTLQNSTFPLGCYSGGVRRRIFPKCFAVVDRPHTNAP